MPGIFNMTVIGIEELQARFDKIFHDLQPIEIAEIVNYALSMVAQEAASKAPVFTGRLKASIYYIMLSELSGEAGVNVPYAAAQEFGFVNRGGQRIPGKNFFTPAAIHGHKILVTELKKYVAAALSRGRARAPRAPRGTRRAGGAAKKYLYKMETGAGTRYVYAKTTQPSSFRFQGRPGTRKQPTTAFQRKKPGGRRR